MRNKLKLQLKGGGIVIDTEAQPKQATSENFGIWSVAENNDFHPDIKSAREAEPKPEDYFLIPFRFISATIVGGESRKATKFPADVLKASMEKLKGCPVYTDHDTETVTNCIGYVESVYWSDGYTAADGTVVPPGIEGNYAIDSKIAPGVGRNLMNGAVNSNSVTVEFYWKPSHTLPDSVSFNDVVGTYDPQGNMYCRVVDEIIDYWETSPVFRGADPFAKGLDKDGKVKKIDKANVFFSAADTVIGGEEEKFQITCTSVASKLNLNKNSFAYQQDSPQNTNTQNMKNLVSFIAKKLNIELSGPDEITDDVAESFIKAINDELANKPSTEEFSRLQSFESTFRTSLGLSTDTAINAETLNGKKIVDMDSYTALETKATKHDELVSEVESLKVERDSFKADAVIGQSFMAELKKEAIRLHTSVSKGNPSEAVLKLINDSKDLKTIEGLIVSFGGAITQDFKATCTQCGNGDHISFQSSKKVDDANKPKVAVLSKEEINERRIKDTDI